MKPAPAASAVALLLCLPGAVPSALHGQNVCPRASGPDAEAGWTAYSRRRGPDDPADEAWTTGRTGIALEVSLAGGYSSIGLRSFSSGASDYRYVAAILGMSWVF